MSDLKNLLDNPCANIRSAINICRSRDRHKQLRTAVKIYAVVDEVEKPSDL